MPPSFKTIWILFLYILPVYGNSQIVFNSSNLPVIYINTDGKTIADDPKTKARLGIIWDTGGGRNIVPATFSNYTLNIGIEIRGSSSQMFPKKSYGFEVYDVAGNDLSVSILGLPEEEDWILYAPYTDKTMMRDVLTYLLYGKTGRYSPRCRYVELVLNNNYQGVYVLMEKIKRAKSRVDIAKLKKEDVSGENVTGGYIVKIDKTTGSGGDGWFSEFNNAENKKTYYQYEYPKSDDITSQQKDYIRNYIHTFENKIWNMKADSISGFRAYIDELSFVDFAIVNELAKNIDGYRLSTFLFKDKNKKLNAGPVWDFNLGYGNANYFDGWKTYGLQLNTDLPDDNWQNPFWWKSLYNDTAYRKKFVNRWEALRTDKFSDNSISHILDSLKTLLSESRYRNFQRWPVIGRYVWPNYYVGTTWESEINWMRNWITQRLSWLDNTFEYSSGTDPQKPYSGPVVSLMPNPFSGSLTFCIYTAYDSDVDIEVFSITGVLVSTQKARLVNGINEIKFADASKLQPAVYIYRVLQNDKIIGNGRMAKIRY